MGRAFWRRDARRAAQRVCACPLISVPTNTCSFSSRAAINMPELDMNPLQYAFEAAHSAFKTQRSGIADCSRSTQLNLVALERRCSRAFLSATKNPPSRYASLALLFLSAKYTSSSISLSGCVSVAVSQFQFLCSTQHIFHLFRACCVLACMLCFRILQECIGPSVAPLCFRHCPHSCGSLCRAAAPEGPVVNAAAPAEVCLAVRFWY